MKLKRWIPRILLVALVAAGTVWLVMAKPWAKSTPAIGFTTVPVGMPWLI